MRSVVRKRMISLSMQVGRKDRDIANFLSLQRPAKISGVIDHPKLWQDFSHQFAMAEKSNYRTLGNYDRHRVGHSTHVCRGDVAAAEAQGHIRA